MRRRGRTGGPRPCLIARIPGILPAMKSITPSYERILEANARYAAESARTVRDLPPVSLAVLTCMDARIDPLAALGLRLGEAHVIRNAGGLATDDAIRSLVISQQLLG